MKNNRSVEIIVGFVVILIATFFAFTIYKSSDFSRDSLGTYKIIAYFDKVDGISEGSKVKIAGISIGKVSKIYLDKDNYNAVLELSVDSDVPLSVDSAAEILTNGMFGEKYVSMIPGAESELLKNGELIEFTQPSISIEQMIGNMIFKSNNINNTQENEKKTEPDSAVTKEEDQKIEENESASVSDSTKEESKLIDEKIEKTS